MDVARGIVDVAGGSSPADRSPAEYYPLLLRAIASLEPDHKRRARRDIYDRARDLLFSKMSSAFPPLSGDDIRQARSVLEHAIEQVEAMVLAPEWAARRLQYRDPPSPPAAANEGLTEAEPDVRVEPGPPVFVDLPPARRSRRRRGIAVAAAMSMAVGAGAILVGLLVHVRATSKPDVAAMTPVSSPVAPKPAMAERESQPATGQPATVDPAPVAPERWAQEVRPSDRPSGEPGGQIGRQLSIAELTAAIRADTKSAKAYLDRGAAFVAQGDIDRAIADFNEAVQRDPYGASPSWREHRRWRARARPTGPSSI